MFEWVGQEGVGQNWWQEKDQSEVIKMNIRELQSKLEERT